MLEDEVRRNPWRVGDFLRRVTWQGIAPHEFDDAPWSSPSFDIGRARSIPRSIFEQPFAEVLCFRSAIVLPPPPVVEQAAPVEVVPDEWIEVVFVDPDGNPVVVGLELELPSGRLMRSNTHTLRTTDRAGSARLRYTPNPGGSRQLHSFPGYHTIRQGQDMQSIAWAYGRTDWQAIWDDSNNDALREACPEPMVLMPGERVYVPEAEDAEPASLAMSERHEITVEVPRVVIRVRFLDGDEPIEATDYEYFANDVPVSGTTDGEGYAEMEVPATQRNMGVIHGPVRQPVERPGSWGRIRREQALA